jgi:hypothetical protein
MGQNEFCQIAMRVNEGVLLQKPAWHSREVVGALD